MAKQPHRDKASGAEQAFLAQALELLARTLQLEYRFIMDYPRLMRMFRDREVKATLRLLWKDSACHADALTHVIRGLGGAPPFPTQEPLPNLPVPEILRKQLEYEKEAQTLHTQAAGLAGPLRLGPLRDIAQQERWHVLRVERILYRLGQRSGGE